MDIDAELTEPSTVACPICEQGNLTLDEYNYRVSGRLRSDLDMRLFVRLKCDTCHEAVSFTAKEGEYIVMGKGGTNEV